MTELRLGIAGAGIAALQVLPNLQALAGQVTLAALADLRADNMAFFRERYGRPVATFDDVDAMCRSKDVDAVWIASPNALHAEHTIAAARYGKHVICEKPMAVTLDQCRAMVEAVERAGIKFVQGHSKVYDTPIRAMGEILASGALGRVIHIDSWNFNDWLLRSLTDSEVDTAQGSGVVFRQGPHQIDIVRFLAGGLVRSVRAAAGRHEPAFPKGEGSYTAFLEFADGTPATLVFDGYGYFDSAELTWGIAESGKRLKNPESRIPRPRPTGPMSAAEKYALVRAGNPYGYGPGGGWDEDSPRRNPFFGLTVVACERGVMRQYPDGIYVYDAHGRREVPAPPHRGRAPELLELYEAVTQDRPTLLDARWGMATTEVCLAILQSARERREITLAHQTRAPVLPKRPAPEIAAAEGRAS
jgi:phthalate 4,5-cis-dihydrodiol dehydrogenase